MVCSVSSVPFSEILSQFYSEIFKGTPSTKRHCRHAPRPELFSIRGTCPQFLLVDGVPLTVNVPIDRFHMMSWWPYWWTKRYIRRLDILGREKFCSKARFKIQKLQYFHVLTQSLYSTRSSPHTGYTPGAYKQTSSG